MQPSYSIQLIRQAAHGEIFYNDDTGMTALALAVPVGEVAEDLKLLHDPPRYCALAAYACLPKAHS